MKIGEFRDLGTDELRQREKDLDDQLFRLRIQKSMGQIEAAHKLKSLRRDLARVKTVLREKEPVYFSPLDTVVLSRYEDIAITLRSNDFSRDIEKNANPPTTPIQTRKRERRQEHHSKPFHFFHSPGLLADRNMAAYCDRHGARIIEKTWPAGD